MFRVRAQIDCDRIPGGYTGKGVTAAILDTGIALHPDFEGRVDHFGDFLHRREKPYDDAGHGTHVAGILAAAERYPPENTAELHRNADWWSERYWIRGAKDRWMQC